MGSTREMPYPGLDGHPRRITPIPIPQAQNQPVSPAMNKSPEQIQEEVSELIQRYENEKAESEGTHCFARGRVTSESIG